MQHNVVSEPWWDPDILCIIVVLTLSELSALDLTGFETDIFCMKGQPFTKGWTKYCPAAILKY
jgi:hypothetical protein